MYLKRLELQGFKSFADKTVLEFMPGITAVIGPNGSGKSNISDAIRWVLGEQSMKSLRGAKSEDVIFAGTQNRKSLGFAEASLIFDNSDGKLPVEYTEVTVTRKIYRSGESGYFINKVPCRLKDVLELFMDTGIGKDGYSIIGQGKIDEILSNKSEDRRHIFEEAAGIVKYRVRKAESEKKLEQTKLNLLRINDILTEIETTIGPLKEQSEKARTFLKLKEELKNIEVGLFLYDIKNYKGKIEQIVSDEDILKNQNEDENNKMSNLNELKEELKQEIDKVTTKIEEKQNLNFENKKNKEKIFSEISISKQKIQNNEENFNRYTQEIEEINNRNNELEEEKNQKLNKKDNLSNNKEKFAKELEEKQAKLDELMKNLSNKEIELEGKKKQVDLSIDEKYEIGNEITVLDANFDNIEKREKTLKSEIQASVSELDSTRLTKEEIAKSFYEIDSKRNKIKKSIEEISEKKDEENRKIKEYEDNINRMLSEYRIKESRFKFLVETEKEKEGYQKSVKSLLLACESNNELKQGVCGVLSNLISVDKKYETAIEFTLGAVLQNIVTENEQVAKKLVEYLRQNNLGRASFLPITSVKGKKIDKINTKNISGEIVIASDLINSDKKYEQIVLNLLGRTVIVEDMQTAINLAKQNNYSFKIVTLKGDVINPSGAISGGSVAQKTINILGRKTEIENLEKELKSLDGKIQKMSSEKEKYIESVEDVFEEVESLEKNLQDIDITYATDKQKLLAVEDNISKIEHRLQKLREELANYDIQKKEILESKQEKENRIQELTIFINDINKEIEEYSLLHKDSQKTIDDLNLEVTNLKISVSSFNESESSIQEILDRIEQEISNNKQNIENKNNQKENMLKDNEALNKKIVELNEQIIKMEEEESNSDKDVADLKEERIRKNDKLKEVEQDIQKQFEVIEGLKEQLVKIDVKKTKLEQELEQVVNNLWDEYEITPNNAEEYPKPSNVQETTKRVNSLRTEIRNLGSVNVDSIEEYKKVSQRYDFMCEQRLDLEDSMAKLRKVINDMVNIMKTQFSEQFKIINNNFGEVFKELFGGGKAELILSDESNILECGIEIQVQPPGKKLQSMTLLSGGEKAFTAIALLFAILKINPSPFCVLDEIEAALDDVNVFRYSDYLKKFIDHTQFLVITHRKGTMEVADTVYGVTMEENGISKLLSMKLK